MIQLEKVTQQLLNEFSRGSKVISLVSRDNKGYLLLEREETVKEEGGGRMFKYAVYQYSNTITHYYLATEYVQMTKKQVKKLVSKDFYSSY